MLLCKVRIKHRLTGATCSSPEVHVVNLRSLVFSSSPAVTSSYLQLDDEDPLLLLRQQLYSCCSLLRGSTFTLSGEGGGEGQEGDDREENGKIRGKRARVGTGKKQENELSATRETQNLVQELLLLGRISCFEAAWTHFVRLVTG